MRLRGEPIPRGTASEGSYARLRDLHTITEAALAHLSFDDLVEELLTRLTGILSVDTAAVLLLDEESNELVATAAKGIEEEVRAGSRIPLGRGFAGRIAAQRRAITIPDLSKADIYNPILRNRGLRALLGVPLLVQGRVIGVLHMGTLTSRKFSAEDSELLQLAADRIALALDHARLYEAERDAAEALRRLEVITDAALAHLTLDADRIARIESITEVALHHITLGDEVLERMLTRVRSVLDADTAALFVTDESTQLLVARAAKGVEERVERGIEIPVGRGFAGRVAELRETVSLADLDGVEVVSPLLSENGVSSLLGVPLVVEERLLGVLHVGRFERRDFDADDRALLELAGERLAVALDHSRIYAREHVVAETLQRSLMPDRPPDVPGAEVASRYLPGEGEAVGGDWFDVVQLADGEVALIMGDVVSRGTHAASVMGQLRNALRAYAAENHEPAMVLARLDWLTRKLDGREMATLAYAVFDPGSAAITYASAGHPPPQVVGSDGHVTLLEDGRGPPLGAVPDAIYDQATASLDPGSTLLLYTDGIVERRDMWLEHGLDRLRECLAAAGPVDPDALLDHLVHTLVPGGRPSDDVALLALRVEPALAGPLRLRLPADPMVLAAMRQSMRQWLAEAGAEEDEVYDVLVATTEAAANAVEHAYGPRDATFDVEVRASRGHEVSVVVRDQGLWRPPRGHNRGRGTLLMQQLMDDFEVATGDAGTEVRMSKWLARALAS